MTFASKITFSKPKIIYLMSYLDIKSTQVIWLLAKLQFK